MANAMNRYSYNQAVNGAYNVNHQQHTFKSPMAMDNTDKIKNDFSLQLPLYHHRERTSSSKMHKKSSSSGSSIPTSIDQYTDFEEEDLSTVDEQLNWLLAGEELLHRELNVGFYKQDKPQSMVIGRVYVTNFRFRFEERLTVTTVQLEPIHFDVTLGSVSKIEKIGYYNVRRTATGIGPPYGLNIVCKDIRDICFIHRRQSHGRRALFECLRKYAFPNSNRLPFFANSYRDKFNHNGWILFDVIREFQRQNVPEFAWSLCKINERYEFAGTYPAHFYVPTEVFKENSPEDFLHSVSEFRSKKRIPVLSWVDHRTASSLVRSSQPLVGALSKKSASDEDYIEMIINSNPKSKSLLILDARPSINAKANRANGGGYEVAYPRCELKFMDIQNIHIVRDSLKKLKDACFPRVRPKRFQRVLEETKWLNHLHTILTAAIQAANQIYEKHTSVLVHCSDGWDRTAQITSLTMLQLDPFYRTIEGFAVLIEKEWCSFGHKFSHRIGHGQEKPDDSERSPIFVQFIDCVWQLYNQFTSSFQFNIRFLKTILDELYSCRFGTFLYNCERERVELQVKQRTESLWSYILDNRMLFINEKYNPEANMDDLISRKTKIHPLFWTDYYCRYSLLIKQSADDMLPSNSIGPSTPLSAHSSETYKNDDQTTPSLSRNRQQSMPLAPETPIRQRRWPTSSTSSQPNYSNLMVTELNQPQPRLNTSTILSSPISNRSSSSTGSELITRV